MVNELREEARAVYRSMVQRTNPSNTEKLIGSSVDAAKLRSSKTATANSTAGSTTRSAAPPAVFRQRTPIHTKFVTAQRSSLSPGVFHSPPDPHSQNPQNNNPNNLNFRKTVISNQQSDQGAGDGQEEAADLLLAPSPRITTILTPRNEMVTSSPSGTVMRRLLPSSQSPDPAPDRALELTSPSAPPPPPMYVEPPTPVHTSENNKTSPEAKPAKSVTAITLSITSPAITAATTTRLTAPPLRTHRRQSSDTSVTVKSPTHAASPSHLSRFATAASSKSPHSARPSITSTSANAPLAIAAQQAIIGMTPLSRQPSLSQQQQQHHHPATLKYAWDKFCSLAADEFTPSDLKLVSCDTLRELMARYHVVLPEEVAHIEAHWALLQDQLSSTRKLDASSAILTQQSNSPVPLIASPSGASYGRWASTGTHLSHGSRSPSGGTMLSGAVYQPPAVLAQDGLLGNPHHVHYEPLPSNHHHLLLGSGGRSPMRGRSVSPSSAPDGRALHPYEMDLRTTVPPAPKLRKAVVSPNRAGRTPSPSNPNAMIFEDEKRHYDDRSARSDRHTGIRSKYSHEAKSPRASGIAHVEKGPDNLFAGTIQPHAAVEIWKPVRHHVDPALHAERKECVRSQQVIERTYGPSLRVLSSDHGITPANAPPPPVSTSESAMRPTKRTFSRVNQSSLALV